MPTPKRKVLLIGWDAADWKVINPMLDAGKMPVLQSLIEDGVMGKLATLTPVLSPMLWTSIATGKRPYKHGIHGFTEPDPKKGGVRPITNLSRKTKAIWNILSQENLKSNIIGWWPSHPVEPINGVMVSNHYQQMRGDSENWPMLTGTVHPLELAAEISKFRVHPSEIEGSQILPFVPKAREIDQKKDPGCWKIAKLLAECASVHASSTAIMQNEEWDFMGIYHDAIDHFCHGFMRYHPPRRAHIDEQQYEYYKDVVEGIYRFHDLMLGTTLKLAGEDTTVILMSDHGFHPDHLRPKEIPQEPNGPAIEHSQHGIFVAKGPGIKKDDTVFGANLLDITPTLLTLFDLPVGEDMDGRALTDIWEQPPTVKTIPSWDDVAGDAGRHPSHFQFDPADDQALLRQLVDLGYVEDPGDNHHEAERKSLRELQFNLARAYIDGDRHGDSIPILEELVAEWPQEFRFLNQLAFSYLSLDRPQEARRTAEQILELKNHLKTEIAEALPALTKQTKDKDFDDLSPELQAEVNQIRSKASAALVPQHLLLGCLFIAEGEPEKALSMLQQIPRNSWTTPVLPIRIGHTYMSIDRYQDAEECFEKALEIDPQNARAYQGLMELMLKQRRYQEAAEHGLTSVGLLYFSPATHYQLGKALLALKHYERAAEAFQVTLSQNPGFTSAYENLAYLYESFLHQPEKAKRYRRQAAELTQENTHQKEAPTSPASCSISERLEIPESWPADQIITIVSGLPRSGTSLMMQMLQAGGLPCLTDGIREADENNPRGYFELEGVKELHRDHSFLDEAKGKVIKIVAPLLPRLPKREPEHIRIIFIERDLDEVLHSQSAMLERLGKSPSKSAPDKMKHSYAKLLVQVNEELENRTIPILTISHRDTITSPQMTAHLLNQFCGGTLDEAAMSAVVDTSLYREKGPASA